MASTVVDIANARSDERLPPAPAPVTVASRILGANALAQSILPTIGTLIKNIGLPALVLVLVLINFGAISDVFGELPGMATRIKSVEGAGFKAELVSAEVLRPVLKREEFENAPEVAAVIKRLAPEQFDRLAFANDGTESCLYTGSKAGQLYRFVAVDHELQDLKLVELNDAPTLVAKLKADTSPEAAKRRAALGDPVHCYTIKQTQLGWQAKYAVVKIVSQTFNRRIDLR
jgi:hypothetical protein